MQGLVEEDQEETSLIPSYFTLKIYYTIVSLLIGILFSVAQNVNDVFQFSRSTFNGSARYIAMGGAFQALGGDLSGMLSNPAGGAVFLNNEIGATLLLDYKNTESIYNGSITTMTGNESDVFGLGQIGVLFTGEGEWFNTSNPQVSFGLVYTAKTYYKNDYVVSGQNTIGIDTYFLNYANGKVELGDIEVELIEDIPDRYARLGEESGFGAQQAFLGYQSFFLDPENPDNAANLKYFSPLRDFGIVPLDQRFVYNISGLHHRVSGNFSFQIDNTLFFGINGHLHRIRYRQTDVLTETGYPQDSAFTKYEFGNVYTTLGNGWSAQAGLIYRLNDNLRLGLTYDLPTYIEFEDDLSQYVENHDLLYNNELVPAIEPNVRNVYPPYWMKIAAKYSCGLAYIFGQSGLLSVDYSLQPLQNSNLYEILADGFQYLQSINNRVKSYFQTVSSLRIGSEFNFDRFSIRAGYYREKSPFIDITENAEGFTGGLGIKVGSHLVNLAFVKDSRTTNHQFYSQYTDTSGTPHSYQLYQQPLRLLISYHYKF